MKPLEHLVVVVDLAFDPRPVFDAARALAPSPTQVRVIALLPEKPGRDGLTEVLEAGPALTWPGLRESSFVTVLDPSRLIEVARGTPGDLVAVGPWAASHSARLRALALLELTSSGAYVISVGSGCPAGLRAPKSLGLALEGGTGSFASLAAQLRGTFAPEQVHAFAQGTDPEQLEELELSLRSLFPAARSEVVPIAASSFGAAALVEREATARGVDVLFVSTEDFSRLSALVLGFFAASLLQDAKHPVVLVPRGAQLPPLSRRLFASDAVFVPGAGLRLTLERQGPLGRAPLLPDETVTLAGHEARGPLPHDEGLVCVPAAWFEGAPPEALALHTTGQPADVAFALVRAPSPELLVLIDAEFPPAAFPDVEPLRREAQLIFVRLRATESLEVLRTRLNAQVPWGGPVTLLDASACLDDGGATDVPSAVDGQRLMRLALRLAAAGFSLAAIVTRDEHVAAHPLLEHFTATGLRSRSPLAARLEARHLGTPRRELLTGSRTVSGHAVALELDNHQARQSLLDSIRAATARIHWQTYIVEDDPIANELLGALVEAGERGVQVRFLVDALYSRYDAFGYANPLLERLSKTPGLEVRGAQRLTGVPSLADLKQRNHRKLITFDGERAIVSGRNLGAEYFTGFDEVPLSARTSYRQVPWLDASVQLRGPLVAAVDEAFSRDWVRAGGTPFPVQAPSGLGELPCRLVLHEGLKDTFTFDAQLELVERAQRRLLVMNTFPLVVELQRALIAAVRRGVRVQLVFGNVRPRWGEEQPFEGGALRELADELVRSRLEPVIAAGGEALELCLPLRAGWDEGLQRVFPHVHAKLLVRDDEELAVGSANVDVTSAYWESEALLVVEDRAFTVAALGELEALLATARRVDLESEQWRKEAARRAWLGRNWPSLVG